MTSLTFMFVDVPEPVWKMSIGNWSSSAPDSISVAADPIAAATSPSTVVPSMPALTSAASALIPASAWITSGGSGRPEIGKLSMASPVSRPHSRSTVRCAAGCRSTR